MADSNKDTEHFALGLVIAAIIFLILRREFGKASALAGNYGGHSGAARLGNLDAGGSGAQSAAGGSGGGCGCGGCSGGGASAIVTSTYSPVQKRPINPGISPGVQLTEFSFGNLAGNTAYEVLN
jgi:hypothetical protein